MTIVAIEAVATLRIFMYESRRRGPMCHINAEGYCLETVRFVEISSCSKAAMQKRILFWEEHSLVL